MKKEVKKTLKKDTKRMIQRVRNEVASLPATPDILAYVNLYQTLQVLYYQKNYKLVRNICKAILYGDVYMTMPDHMHMHCRCQISDNTAREEDKQEIVKRLKELLVATRAGSGIIDLALNEMQDEVTIIFAQGTKAVNVAADSGYAIIKDVMKALS